MSNQSEGINFGDIILQHNFADHTSRSECDISIIDPKGKHLKSPVILSNMPCCQNDAVLGTFNKAKWPYVYHRTKNDTMEFLEKITEENWYLKSISVGVQESDLALLRKIKARFGVNALDWLTIDVAFIYNVAHQEFIYEVRKLFPNTYLIAGNFTNRLAVRWLNDLGVNAGKFGISTSLLCRTGDYTGFASCATDLLECTNEAYNLADFDIIQDGGIRILDESTGESAYGDIFKAINFGARWVMSSSLFRWCSELALDDGMILQYGNSTEMAKGHAKNIEGAVKTFKTNGKSIKDQMQTITENLQSSMSYAGIKNLDHAHAVCGWRIIK